MTKAELVIYYKDNYEVTEEEVEEFTKKNKEGEGSMIEELTSE